MEQMVCDTPPAITKQGYDIEVLNLDDVPEMKQLAELTEPGPFRKRTIDFGGYLGVRSSDRLVSMAGYRIRPAGFTEISAVCTHPDYRGRGYAKALVAAVAHSIFSRDETPFLGVRHDNIGAIRLYEKLGFKIRQRQYVAVLKKPQ
jgi:predicted GNAT family acetyltransferase